MSADAGPEGSRPTPKPAAGGPELFPTVPEGSRLTGTVTREVFRSATGGFAVLRLELPDGEIATVAGDLPPAQPGEGIEADGAWVDDPRHGRQFQAEHARVRAPSSTDAVTRFLGSGAVAGVGPELARRIVDVFGERTLGVLEGSPAELLQIKGIGRKKLEGIRRSWEEQRASREAMLALRGHGLGPVLAQRVHTRFGAETQRVLEEDPYALAREVEGVGFVTADRLARALGLAVDDARRLRAGLLHVANEGLSRGDTAVPTEALLEQAARALGVAPDLLEPALTEARGALVLELDRPDPTAGADEVVYLPSLLRAERGAAALTAALVGPAAPRRLPAMDAERAVAWLADRHELALSAAQADAIRAALEAPLTVVTGGPGVGKTTVVRSLVEVLRARRVRFALAAPTGRAAKRLDEATGAPAMTLHRLLEWDPRGGGFGRDASAPLEVDMLVVDEASMVDVRLYHALIRALPAGASLVLIGDVDQLPSVGPGSVLADLIGSGAARVVRLTEVFRQAAASRIVTVAHAINEGQVPDLAPDPGERSDFFFAPAADAEAARELIVRLVRERIPERFGLDPLRDVQVLAPMHRGACGTDALNRALKAGLNPRPGAGEGDGGEGQGDDAGARKRLDVGDKVMQLRNDYEQEVFNGDVGRVVHLDPDGAAVVSFDGREVLYTRGERSRLALAYCATIHKAQGSEYPVVVLPVLTEHFVMLERNLLYTAITRARRLAVLVGQRRAIEVAVANDRPRQRLSFLGVRIRQALAPRTDAP